MNAFPDTEYAWAAGFIEADGAFTLRAGYRTKKGHEREIFYVQPVVTITQFNPEPLYRLQALAGGGNICKIASTQGGKKKYHNLQITGRKRLAFFLEQILPYLGHKRQQALLLSMAINQQMAHGESGYSPEEVAWFLAVKDLVQELNKYDPD